MGECYKFPKLGKMDYYGREFTVSLECIITNVKV